MADPYDKPGLLPDDEELRHRTGIGKDEETAMDREAHNGAAGDLAERENLFNPTGDSEGGEAASKASLAGAESNPSDTLGEGYTPDDNPRSQRIRKWAGKHKKKAAIGGGVTATILALIIGGFSALQPFKLAHFMENVDATAFGRFQVDMRDRSSKWLQAYMVLRLGEVDDPKLAPKDRDNVLFRANRVDTNRPLTDWYRTMRASKFETDLFEKHGIKFTSFAYKDGVSTKIRPAIISVNNEPITFTPNQAELRAIDNVDPNSLNGRLSRFVDIQVLNNDKEARLALKAVVKERYPHWWNAAKRYHVRHDIQNMIGVRNWRFFEETRDKAYQKRVDIRNKIVVNMLPDNTRSGRFVQCLFGIITCKASNDALNTDAIAESAKPRGDDKTCETGCSKDEQDKPLTTENGADHLTEGLDAGVDAAENGVKKTLVSEIIKKANLATGVASLLDSLARFDKSLNSHGLSQLVTRAKMEQAAGLFTTFAIASDQLKTGKVTSAEVGGFMSAFGNPTNNSAWAEVIDPVQKSNSASAASQTNEFVEAKNKADFCSEEHQAEIDKPENYAEADKEFQYLCPQYQVGDTNNRAQELESTWNNGPGRVLHPILDAYHTATGGIFSVVNRVFDFVAGPIIDGILKALGLSDDLKQVVAWVAEKAMAYFGGGPIINENTPSGQVANVALEGGAVVAEASMRQQGAAKSTPKTTAFATQRYLAYQTAANNSASLYERYVAVSNPRSFLSKQLFAISNLSLTNISDGAFKVFGNALAGPSKLINSNAGAAVNSPYAAASFAGIQTFDFPSECLNANPLEMTPASATNADDLGYIPADELNWDIMSNKETWGQELYSRIEDGKDQEEKAMQVWNCALLDNTARGSVGALYGYKGEDALSN